MRRVLRPSLALIALALALLVAPVGAAPAPPPGNSAAAKACQNGGYAQYIGPDGQPFRTPGECVQFVAQGGTLQMPLAPLTLTATVWPMVPGATVGAVISVLLTGYTFGDRICFTFVEAATGAYVPSGNESCYDTSMSGNVYLPALFPDAGCSYVLSDGTKVLRYIIAVRYITVGGVTTDQRVQVESPYCYLP